jgi:hypothetical protein
MTSAMVSRNINVPCKSPGSRSSRICWVTFHLGLSIALSLSACNRGKKEPPQHAAARPVLSAEPNPVPAGDPNQPVGTTVITWNTGNGTIGNLYVKVDRGPEVFVTRGPSGTHEIHWIQFDSFYEFRLYAKKRSKLLAKLAVTRDD